jgi:hypothetical protein
MFLTRRARLFGVLVACHILTACALAWPGKDKGDAGKNSTSLASAVVPFEMLASNHMVVTAKLNGKDKTYRFIFDLGAPVTLISNRAAETSGAIKSDAPRAFLFGARGEGKLDKLEIGELKAESLPVIVMDHPAVKFLGESLGRPLDGIIGYTFFARYKTTIDYQAKCMTFTPVKAQVRNLMQDLPGMMTQSRSAKTKILAPGALWGVTLGEPTGGLSSPGVPITTVLSHSSAEKAGLKPGDILTTLDGRWTTSVADVYAAAAAVSPGESVPVIVLRDGKEITLSVAPKDGI